MRYIIEPKTEEAGQKLLEFLGEIGDNKYYFISEYEPVERLSRQVDKIGKLLREYKESGISWKVFNYYLRGKGIAQREIDNVLAGVEDFFKAFSIKK